MKIGQSLVAPSVFSMEIIPSAMTNRRKFLTTAGAAAIAPLILRSGLRANPPSESLRVAFIGIGRRMNALFTEIFPTGTSAAWLCDVDLPRAAAAKTKFAGHASGARVCQDYREVFAAPETFDAVVISTPDHWHASQVKRALAAGKPIFCEKPLTHTIGEARELRELSRKAGVVTQTGNQGSASPNLRRSIEIIRSGLLGSITDIHIWHPPRVYAGAIPGLDRADPIPEGFNWDFWCGPSRVRPYKTGVFHPFRWRDWFDYGNGFAGDFCCHAFNVPARALDLGHPARIEVVSSHPGSDAVSETSRIRYHFPAKGERAPVTIHLYEGEKYIEGSPLDVMIPTFGEIPRVGCLLVGENGHLSAGLWNTDCHIKLKDEERFRGAANHPAAREIPESLPRSPGHMNDWINAIRNGGTTHSDFDAGGLLTEIGLTGALALQLGQDISWDGETLTVPGHPEAARLVHRPNRQDWL